MCRLLPCLLLISVSPLGFSERWALLLAGSSRYDNYRHQSSVYRVRNFLKQNGVNMDNVYIFANQVPFCSRNKAHCGKLYARPGGPDVYGGVHPDYEGNEINPDNLQYALLGDKRASGSYLKSTNEDYIFIYYAGLGGQGLLRFGEFNDGKNSFEEPTFLYQDDFQLIIEKMIENRVFRKLLIFIDSYRAESMLMWLDDQNIRDVYAISSSTTSGKSFAKYCPSYYQENYPMPGIHTCLSLRATSEFFGIAEKVDLESISLGILFDWAQNQTAAHKVPQFMSQHGDMSMREIKASQFFGRDQGSRWISGKNSRWQVLYFWNSVTTLKPLTTTSVHDSLKKPFISNEKILEEMLEPSDAWSEFNHDQMALRSVIERLAKKAGGKELQKKREELKALMKHQNRIRTIIRNVVKDLYGSTGSTVAELMKNYTYGTTNFACLQKTIEKLEICSRDEGSYALLYSNVFYTMCSKYDKADILELLEKHCC